jgi:hypothetical protein
VAVAITGRFSEPLAADEVTLPFHPRGRANSGLRKPCVAKCSWLETIEVNHVIEPMGFVSASIMRAILERIDQSNPQGA